MNPEPKTYKAWVELYGNTPRYPTFWMDVRENIERYKHYLSKYRETHR